MDTGTSQNHQDELARRNRRAKVLLIIFGILGVGVIPVTTLINGLQEDPFIYSMSSMGSMPGRHLDFIIWTLILSAYFLAICTYLLILIKGKKSFISLLTRIGLVILVFGNALPYLPDTLPFWADLHVYCAQISSVSMVAVLLLIILNLRAEYPRIFSRSLTVTLIFLLAALAIMSKQGVVSATEMIVIIGGCATLFYILDKLYQSERLNVVVRVADHDAMTARERAQELSRKADRAYAEYLKLAKEAEEAQREASTLHSLAERYFKISSGTKKEG
jgi:signal transduction histidine kinase